MYSENYGASWNIVARNLFTSVYAHQYLLKDFNWYGVTYLRMHMRNVLILFTLGVCLA